MDFTGNLLDNQLLNLINEFPDKTWSWYGIACNPNLNMKFILDNPDKSWDWFRISCNTNITLQNILDNPDKPWDWHRISRNKFNKDKIVKERLYKQIEFRRDCYTLLEPHVIPNIAYIITMFIYIEYFSINELFLFILSYLDFIFSEYSHIGRLPIRKSSYKSAMVYRKGSDSPCKYTSFL